MTDFTSMNRRTLLTAAVALPLASCLSGSAADEDLLLKRQIMDLHQSLNPQQRKLLCRPAAHKHRQYTNNNWTLMPQTAAQILSPAQLEQANAIFRGLHSPAFVPAVIRQVEEDNGGTGIGGITLAFFGEALGHAEPGGLGLVFAGRHITRRWEEASLQPYGGTVFCGHASHDFDESPEHEDNIWWYQGLLANELFQSLTPAERASALSQSGHLDTPACFKGPRDHKGFSFARLDPDRLSLAAEFLSRVLEQPFRATDAARARAAIQANGGIKALNIHFFCKEDLGDDGVWDNFEVWGPNFMYHFRGNPHCHAWIKLSHPKV